MADRKLLQRLLRMKGFRITWFELYERRRRVFIGVKPHKTVCTLPIHELKKGVKLGDTFG